MSTISKRDVKYCPRCASTCTPEVGTPYSICSQCGLEFTVSRREKRIVAQEGKAAQQRECGGKEHGFDSVPAAFEFFRDVPETPTRKRDKMRFYICRWCSRVHMGHEGKKKKNVGTVEYTYEQAKALYEQQVCNQ